MKSKRLVVSIFLLMALPFCGKNLSGPGEESQGKLVFVVTDTTVGPFGLYTMNLDGSELQPIAMAGDTIYFPGSWGDYYVLRSGNAPSFVTNPQWSPDGSRIVCQLTWAYDGYVIMMMNADGTDKHVLWKVRSAATRPQWSPEGDKILFMRSGYAGAVFATGIVDASGENDHDFATPVDSPYVFEGDSVWFYGDYQWGPTGKMIYATARVNKPIAWGEYKVGDVLENEIFSLDSHTGAILGRITRNRIDEDRFLLSPDGRYAAFKRGKYGQSNSFFVLSLENWEVTEIPCDNTIGAFWNWSNDSKKIVFAKDENPDPCCNQDMYLYMVAIEQPDKITKLTNFIAAEPDLYVTQD